MVAYSEVADLLTGKIPTPSSLDPQKYVDDATDEIDSKIGLIYKTPIDLGEFSDVPRPVRLLLKRINNFLASGRLILAVASPQEQANLHAYGWSLVREATAALDSIASGEVTIDGAERLTDDTVAITAPLISNVDSESNVEAFYDRLANPDYHFFPHELYTGRWIR